MRSPTSGRAVPLLLAGAFVFSVAAASAAWAATREQVPVCASWLLAGALLTLAATGWAFVRRTAAATAAARAEITALLQRLGRKRARIDDLSGSHGRFAGNIAHEIKTPLTTVLAQTDLLLACSDDPAAVRTYARSIGEDMRHLSDLVESFLRLARPFAQADTSHHVPVYVHDFVVDAVRRCRSQARDSGVSVVPTLAESSNGDAPLEVLGDNLLLEAMVENLVRNAVRFSRRGSRVELQVQVDGERILLQVRDHGTGIAPEHLESVFDWFFQAPGFGPQSPGTGFGLAIARRVAEHHHGTISVRNRPEGGCEFEITLPRWRTEDLPSPAATAAVDPPPGATAGPDLQRPGAVG